MGTTKNSPLSSLPERLAISDEDIYKAMKEISGYLDITTGDFKELYQHSYHHAIERLSHSICARDIMSRNVVSVTETTPLLEVANRMADASISGVPVMDDNKKVVGIVSEQDFLKGLNNGCKSFMAVVARCLQGLGGVDFSISMGMAGDIMSRPPVTIKENTPLVEITEIMSKNKINRLPVLDQEEKVVVGIVSRDDLVRAQLL